MSRHGRDADTLLLVGLLVVAVALRLYCFVMAQGQPLWWDEAEYMLKAKAFIYGTPDTGWYTSRPIAFPLLAAAVLKIGGGEETIRLLWLGLSMLSLVLVCRIGEILFNRRVGLYAGAVYAVFYVDLFFSARLLVDMPQVFFVLVAAYLLAKDQFGGGATHGVWAIVPVLALGVATRFTVAIFFAVLALFLIAVRGRRIFRATEWYVSAALGLLVMAPFLAYYWLQYGHPMYPFLTHVGFKHAGPPSEVAMAYVRHFPYYMGLPVLAFFLCGLVQAVATAGSRLRRIGDDPQAQRHLLLLLWIVLPFLFFAFLVDHFEDRYIAMIFPAVFLIAAACFDTFCTYLGRYRFGAVAVPVMFVGMVVFGLYPMARNADTAIAAKARSFDSVREAGLWIRENSADDDVVISASVPQITYYAERATFAFPDRETDFQPLLDAKSPKYLVVSSWQGLPPWAHDWLRRHRMALSVAHMVMTEDALAKVSAIVYAIRAPASKP